MSNPPYHWRRPWSSLQSPTYLNTPLVTDAERLNLLRDMVIRICICICAGRYWLIFSEEIFVQMSKGVNRLGSYISRNAFSSILSPSLTTALNYKILHLAPDETCTCPKSATKTVLSTTMSKLLIIEFFLSPPRYIQWWLSRLQFQKYNKN